MRTKVTGLGDVGLITDRDPHDTPVNGWDRLHNMRCRNGYVAPVAGYADATTGANALTPAATTQDVHIHALGGIEYDGTYTWVFPFDYDDDGGAETIYYWDGTNAPAEITRQISAANVDYTDSSTHLWNVCNFNGVILLNNGQDNPQYWTGDTATKCLPIPYDGSTVWSACDVSETEFDTDGAGGVNDYKAKVIRPFKNYLFALNITEDTTNYPQMVHWSNPADPGSVPDSWDYRTATNDAGRTVLAETDGRVLDAVALGDQLILYKEDAIYRASYIGGQFIFDFDMVTRSHGLWATNCVVDIGNQHVCLGDGVIYTHSGGQPQNILDGKAADAFFSEIDEAQYEKCFVFHRKGENEVWFCYPELGETWCTKAYVWQYASNTWYTRDLPKCSTIKSGIVSADSLGTWDAAEHASKTWEDDAFNVTWGARDYSPIGDTPVAAEQQLVQFTGETTDSVVAEKRGLLLGDHDSWTMVRGLFPESSGDAFSVRIGTQEVIQGAVTWQDAQTFTPGSDYKQDWRISGRVFSVRFSGTGTYKISGYAVDFTPVGRR